MPAVGVPTRRPRGMAHVGRNREGAQAPRGVPRAHAPMVSVSRQGEQQWPRQSQPNRRSKRCSKIAQWQAQAERPGILDQLGPKWREFLATKGQGLKAYMEDLQLAYTMLRDPHFQIAKETKTVLIIALIYIVSPIDLLPDAIPFLGLVDDVLVAGYALRQASGELARYKQTVRTP